MQINLSVKNGIHWNKCFIFREDMFENERISFTIN